MVNWGSGVGVVNKNNLGRDYALYVLFILFYHSVNTIPPARTCKFAKSTSAKKIWKCYYVLYCMLKLWQRPVRINSAIRTFAKLFNWSVRNHCLPSILFYSDFAKTLRYSSKKTGFSCRIAWFNFSWLRIGFCLDWVLRVSLLGNKKSRFACSQTS